MFLLALVSFQLLSFAPTTAFVMKPVSLRRWARPVMLEPNRGEQQPPSAEESDYLIQTGDYSIFREEEDHKNFLKAADRHEEIAEKSDETTWNVVEYRKDESMTNFQLHPRFTPRVAWDHHRKSSTYQMDRS